MFLTRLIWVNEPSNDFIEQVFQGIAPLKHLLNEDTLFMYFWRYYLMKEVNEWTLSVKKIGSLRNVFSFNWQKIT